MNVAFKFVAPHGDWVGQCLLLAPLQHTMSLTGAERVTTSRRYCCTLGSAIIIPELDPLSGHHHH